MKTGNLIIALLLITTALEGRGGRGSGFHGEGSVLSTPSQRSLSMSRSLDILPADISQFPGEDKAQSASIAKPATPQRAIAAPQSKTIEQIIENSPERYQELKNRGEEIRGNLEKDPPDSTLWRRDVNTAKSSWKSIAEWLSWNEENPVYYDYGRDGNLFYEGDTVYIDNEPTYSAGQYAEQARKLASEEPQEENNQLLPLGFYALSSNEAPTPLPNMFLKLSLGKDGSISGTYLNTITNTSEVITGHVDEKSQRAAWTLLETHDAPVMETGLYNLAQDQTNALIHFPNKATQTWFMVPLEASDKPESSQK